MLILLKFTANLLSFEEKQKLEGERVYDSNWSVIEKLYRWSRIFYYYSTISTIFRVFPFRKVSKYMSVILFGLAQFMHISSSDQIFPDNCFFQLLFSRDWLFVMDSNHNYVSNHKFRF